MITGVRRILILACALLSGVSGLGLEGVLLSAAGLALGYARASALGLGTFIAGWALGAWSAGRAASVRRTLLLSGVLLAISGSLAPWIVFRLARAAPGGGSATVAGLAALLLAGLAQGVFLPCLARIQAPRSSVAPLFAANLLGSVIGAGLLGFTAVAAFGRIRAALLSAAIGLIACVITAVAAGSERDRAEPRTRGQGALGLGQAGWVLGMATLWLVALEWIGVRLLVLWIDSLQATLTSVLAASLLSLALGAALLPLLMRMLGAPRSLALLWFLMLAGSAWPLFAAPLLSQVSARGQAPFVVALSLCLPMLAPFGALVPCLHANVRGESGKRLGDLLLHEAWGALLAGPIVHLVLVPRFGLGGAIACLAGSAFLISLAFARSQRVLFLALAPVSLACAFLLARLEEPARSTPLLNDPALRVRSFTEDAQFAVTVIDDGMRGERTLLTDRFRAAGTGRDYAYMRVLGHLPLLLHPDPRRVAVLALGTGTTVGAVARHREPERIDVLEISRAVVEAAPWFAEQNFGALTEERVAVILGDGRRSLGARPSSYDVVTIEPLLPDSPFGVYLYTEEFYTVARRSLAPGGLVCQWVPPHALPPESFAAVLDAFERSFEWTGVWLFGTQVILLGGEAQPELQAARFPAPGTPLFVALSGLGLETPDGLAARWVGPKARDESGARRLSDDHPWIVFRPLASGVEVLGWLPENLRALLARSEPPPEDWLAPGGRARWLAHSSLREARYVMARGELELRLGRETSAALQAEIALALEPARRDDGADPELRALLEEVEFLASLRAGVTALASADTSDATLGLLLRAAELRPERADTHLYVATAWHLRDTPRLARAAMERALELCPRALETPAGKRAVSLGLAR